MLTSREVKIHAPGYFEEKCGIYVSDGIEYFWHWIADTIYLSWEE